MKKQMLTILLIVVGMLTVTGGCKQEGKSEPNEPDFITTFPPVTKVEGGRDWEDVIRSMEDDESEPRLTSKEFTDAVRKSVAKRKTKQLVTGMLSGIQSFLTIHSEFGTPSSVQNVPNWAQGKRQRIQFTNGRNLLFYLQNGLVVTVYENNPTRTKIWGSYNKLEPGKPEIAKKKLAIGMTPAETEYCFNSIVVRVFDFRGNPFRFRSLFVENGKRYILSFENGKLTGWQIK